jgi:hypothetical protein
MNYEEFRILWHEALQEAGLISYHFRPEETIDINWMTRTYGVYVSLGVGRQKKPFSASAHLSWRWDYILIARSATTEEDLLRELLGQGRQYVDTEPPWLRVDVVLRASTPWGSPLPWPDETIWQRWASEVRQRLEPLLPIDAIDKEHGMEILSYRGDPTAELTCESSGRVVLTGVELAAWEGIVLPRQWDDPEREMDPWPEDQLADFADRVRQSLEEWEDCLHLMSTS